MREDGPRAVAEIVRVSREGRAPKNDPALFALALAAGLGDVDDAPGGARGAAAGRAERERTCSSSSTFAEGFRGWGRALRRAVGRWYAAQPVDALAYQAVKYRQRDGRHAPRPAPTRAPGAAGSAPATRRSTSRTSTLACSSGSSAAARPTACRAWSRASSARRRRRRRARRRRSSASTTCRARRSGRSTWPRPEVWEALLDGHADDGADPQPGDDDARRRDRAGLGRHRDVRSRSSATRSASVARGCTRSPCSRRSAPTRRATARAAAASGTRSARSSTRSTPRSTRRSATSSRRASACCSRSTCPARWTWGGRRRPGPDAARRLGRARARHGGDGARYEIVGFSPAARLRSGAGPRLRRRLTPLAISPRQRLDDAVRAVSDLPFGGTDCALPMLYAQAQRAGGRHVRDLHRLGDLGGRRPPGPGAPRLPPRVRHRRAAGRGRDGLERVLDRRPGTIRGCSTSSASTRRRRSSISDFARGAL